MRRENVLKTVNRQSFTQTNTVSFNSCFTSKMMHIEVSFITDGSNYSRGRPVGCTVGAVGPSATKKTTASRFDSPRSAKPTGGKAGRTIPVTMNVFPVTLSKESLGRSKVIL